MPPQRPPAPGACDTHTHVFGPYERFPLGAHASYAPPPATVEDHLDMLSTVGIARGVVVQPAPYGTDCAAILDAVARSDGRLCGVGAADATATDRALETLVAGGVAGLRFVEIALPGGAGRFPGAVGLDALTALAPRMRALGLHAQLWIDPDRLAAEAEGLAALGVPIVVEHMGRLDPGEGLDAPATRALLALLARGSIWVKLSVCRVPAREPDRADLRPLHDALVAANPERLLWGSDWPHVRMADAPDVGRLVDLFDSWVGDETLRRRILVDNPAALYAFPPVRA